MKKVINKGIISKNMQYAISSEIKRCETGIEDLDNILNGGFPEGNTILLSGACGTGKTTLSLEYSIRGALAEKNSLFISVTEPFNKLLLNTIPYDFYDSALIEKNKLIFVDLPMIYKRLGLKKSEFSSDDVKKLVQTIADIIKEGEVKRLVIDSITPICYHLNTKQKICDFILQIANMVSELDCTTVLVSEMLKGEGHSMFGVEEGLVDGVILMENYERRGDLLRTLQIIKMRGTGHSRARYVIDLTKGGVLLTPLLKGD
jgi:circadian clock protein KaiC